MRVCDRRSHNSRGLSLNVMMKYCLGKEKKRNNAIDKYNDNDDFLKSERSLRSVVIRNKKGITISQQKKKTEIQDDNS